MSGLGRIHALLSDDAQGIAPFAVCPALSGLRLNFDKMLDFNTAFFNFVTLYKPNNLSEKTIGDAADGCTSSKKSASGLVLFFAAAAAKCGADALQFHGPSHTTIEFSEGSREEL